MPAAWPCPHRSSGRSSRGAEPPSRCRDRAPAGAPGAARRCTASSGAAWYPWPSPSLQVLPALAAHAELLGAFEAIANARRAAVVAEDRHVRDVDRHVLVDDAALHRGARRALVAFGDIDAVDDDAVALGDHSGDLAVLSDILAGEHDDVVALLQLHGHKTSGASDTMRMNLRS